MLRTFHNRIVNKKNLPTMVIYHLDLTSDHLLRGRVPRFSASPLFREGHRSFPVMLFHLLPRPWIVHLILHFPPGTPALQGSEALAVGGCRPLLRRCLTVLCVQKRLCAVWSFGGVPCMFCKALQHSRGDGASPNSHVPHTLLSAGVPIRREVTWHLGNEKAPHGAFLLFKNPGLKAVLSTELSLPSPPTGQAEGRSLLNGPA